MLNLVILFQCFAAASDLFKYFMQKLYIKCKMFKRQYSKYISSLETCFRKTQQKQVHISIQKKRFELLSIRIV